LAGVGEEDLLDQVADMVFLIGLGSAPPVVDAEGVVDLHQIPLTLDWVKATESGVPGGVEVALLSASNNGTPKLLTLCAPTVHCALTHGPLPLGGGLSVQASTV